MNDTVWLLWLALCFNLVCGVLHIRKLRRLNKGINQLVDAQRTWYALQRAEILHIPSAIEGEGCVVGGESENALYELWVWKN